MNKRDVAAIAGSGGIFSIGLVFFIIGMSTSITFLPLGIALLFAGMSGWWWVSRQQEANGKDAASEGSPAESEKSSGE